MIRLGRGPRLAFQHSTLMAFLQYLRQVSLQPVSEIDFGRSGSLASRVNPDLRGTLASPQPPFQPLVEALASANHEQIDYLLLVVDLVNDPVRDASMRKDVFAKPPERPGQWPPCFKRGSCNRRKMASFDLLSCGYG